MSENTNHQVPQVYKAICSVTAEMAKEGIAKTRKNEQQGYRFRGVDDVYCALCGVLSRNGLCMLPRVVERTSAERPTKSGGVSTFTTLTVEFDLVSAFDGSMHTIRTVGEAMDTADKSSNKAQSAAFKYACFLAFQIPTEGDNDADASHYEKAEREAIVLEGQLSQSVAWGDREVSFANRMKAARNPGELLEVWSEVSTACQSAPNGTLKRLAVIKDAKKAALV